MGGSSPSPPVLLAISTYLLLHSAYHRSGSTNPSFGVYACLSCLSSSKRCLIPLLAHVGHKRFRAHACQLCDERGTECSLDGTVMVETATGA